MPCHFGGCPCSGLSWVHSPGRQNLGSAEARRRRGAEDTAVPPRLSISPAPRAQNGHQEPRAPGGRQVAGDRRAGGGQASRCGESWPAGRPDQAREGRESAEKAGPRRAGAAGARGPGPGGRLPRSPPGAAIAPRSAPRGARSSRLLPAPPGSSRAERGVPVPSCEPGTRARRRSWEPD